MKEQDKVRFETVKFMRGNYRLDEVAGMYYDTPLYQISARKENHCID